MTVLFLNLDIIAESKSVWDIELEISNIIHIKILLDIDIRFTDFQKNFDTDTYMIYYKISIDGQGA